MNFVQDKLNIVFMGTSVFAVPALKRIFEFCNVVAVYTKSPKPVGRKQIITKTPVNILADELGIPVVTPKSFNDDNVISELKLLKPDMIVVAAYGIILPECVINLPKFGCINIHASLLPFFRGANPIQRAILEGHKSTGISIMRMDCGIDTGDILISKTIPILPNVTYGELSVELSKIGADLIIEYIDHREKIKSVSQGNDYSVALKLSSSERFINWNDTAENIHNKVRGLNPYCFATCFHNSMELKIIKTELVDSSIWGSDLNNKVVGTVLDKNLNIVCGNKTIIKILVVQKIGGKQMFVKDFLNGYKINVGDILK